jgi:hypothetical protein
VVGIGTGNRRGFALLFAVAALATLGSVSFAVLLLARGERQSGQLAVARVQARGAALGALAHALSGWPAAATPSAPGDSAIVAGFSRPGITATATLHSLGGPVLALRSSGARIGPGGQSLAEARLELLVLLQPADSNSVVRARAYPRGYGWLP